MTPEEITQARALSSPEIPDDDETAKQPTRQLVRKMLAHIDALTKDKEEANKLLAHKKKLVERCQEVMAGLYERGNSALERIAFMELHHAECEHELKAALDAKEKAEAKLLEASVIRDLKESGVYIRQETCEARCAELQAIVEQHSANIVILLRRAQNAEATVESLKYTLQYIADRKDRTSITVLHLGEVAENKLKSTREAALSATASSGAKEKQS